MHRLIHEMQDWIATIADAGQRPRERAIVLEKPTAPGFWDQGQMAGFSAGLQASLGLWTGDERHYDCAREFLLVPTPVAPFSAGATHMAVTLLRAAGKFSADDEQRICSTMTGVAKNMIDVFLGRLYGMRRFNHALTTANLCDAVARLWPDSPDAKWLLEQVEPIWEEWWPLGENVEGAPTYEGFMQVALLQWADRRGERERIMSDPRTGIWIDRGLDHFLPVGFMPAYGDSHMSEHWPDWIALWSMVALWDTGERGGRARWSVERMFDYFVARDWIRNIDIVSEQPADGTEWAQVWYQVPPRGMVRRSCRPLPPRRRDRQDTRASAAGTGRHAQDDAALRLHPEHVVVAPARRAGRAHAG